MSVLAKKTDPALWDRIKRDITLSDKGGGYAGRKTQDNLLQPWTAQDWGTKSGTKSKPKPREAAST